MKKIFKPEGPWMLVDPESTEENYGTSFTSADDNIKKPKFGKVVDKGLDVPGVEAGDRIFYQTNGTVELELEEKLFILVHKERLLGSWKTT